MRGCRLHWPPGTAMWELMRSLKNGVLLQTLVALGLAGALSFFPLPARAQAQFEATYTLSMAGISIGKSGPFFFDPRMRKS